MLGGCGRVLRPERHGGSTRYSCSVHWTSLAQADSVLTHLPSLHVSTITTWSNGFGDPNDTRARHLHNHNMIKRVLRPERHEGVSSPQSQYGQTGLATRTTRGRVVSTITARSNGSGDPNDTRACRLNNHCMHRLSLFEVAIVKFLGRYDGGMKF